MAGNDAAGQPLTNHPTFITYSFQNNTGGLSIEGNGQAFANSFRILSDIEKANARAAFAEWDKWSGITFLEVPSGQGDIKLAHFNFDLGGPYTSAQAAAYGGGGIVFVSEKVVGSVQLMLHEIGHNLGLKHPFEGDFTLPKSSDSYETTVMSYTSGGTNGSTLGTLDKDAIAYLYGAPGTDGSQVASWNWDASIYQLTQVGRDIAETITGISSADIIEGRGGDDRINGRGGDDRLYGGAGNDLIDGGDGRDLIDGGDGNDTLSGSSFSGDRTGGDTLYGGAGQDVLFGDRGGFFDLLDGGDGDDTIYANAGDSIYGGAGDDQILLQSIADLGTTIIDGGAGNDRVSISFAGTADRTLTTTSLRLASVETLMLYTGAGNDLITDDSGLTKVDLSGGAGDDVIRAGSGEGSIRGDAGNDVLFAGTGFTFLYGGAGADRFVFASASTSPNARADQIEDFETGIDVIDLSAMGATNIRIEAAGTSNWITATAKDGAFRLFVRQAVSLSDIVTQSGLITGTAGNDVLKGSAANDMIYGYAGNDSLDGGAGNDLIDGGDGQDTLVGGSGIDTLIGGLGNDLYVIGSITTAIRENAGEGTDTAIVTAAAGLTSYTLNADAQVEIVSAEAGTAKINITGNGFSQIINGNDGANILSTGGGAPDTLNGGLGDDIYRVFSTGDVIEDSGGFDTVYASGTSYFLYSTASVEYLSTSEQAGTQGFYMVGNGASQVIVGNYGDNTINGRGGDGVLLPDTLIGLFGNDTYGVFSQGDVVREVDGQGTDVVYANASYQLRTGASIEILSAVDQSATGAANAFTLRGNAFAQTVAGNGADNVLDGRGGNDTLVGLGGADVFAFTTALDGASNVDTIRDFGNGADRIGLATDIFAGVTDGGITASEFVIGTAAADADDRLIYDQATGRLWYDTDGNGAGAQILFAQLSAGTAMTAASFTPIAPVAELAAA